MRRRDLVGVLTVSIVVLIVAGALLLHFVGPRLLGRNERSQVASVVEGFGSKLKDVSLSVPEEVACQEIEQVYAPFVSPHFLSDLMHYPSGAPGRSVSSPWPERIEIVSMEKLDVHTIKVTGNIILMTSVEVTQGGNAGKTPIVLWVRNTTKNGAWLIDLLSYGVYASYDPAELTVTLKRAFSDVAGIGEGGDLFIAQTIDMNGDSVPEALVDLQTGGAYTEYYAICQVEDGKLCAANFRDKNAPLSWPKLFWKGASAQHEVKLNFVDDGKGNRVICQYAIDKSASDPAVTEKITVEAYKWNGTTKEFGYDEGLSIAFEQEEERLLMPRVLTFVSLDFKEVASNFSAIDAVAVRNGKVAYSTGTGKIQPNAPNSATTDHVVISDVTSGRTEYSMSVSKKWARILDVQMNDRWVLFKVLEDPGEIPSECFAINRRTNELIKLLPDYDWGEEVSPDTTVFTVFDRTLLQGDYAYLVIMSEDMVASGDSTSFRSGAGGTRLIRANLKDGKQENVFTPPVQSFSIRQICSLDNDSVAFDTSEVMVNGDTRDQVYFYDPSTTTLKSVFIDQYTDSSDPRSIGTYTITPDRKIVYALNKRIVIAPVATPGDFTEVGVAESNDYISDYIVASDDYLVARLDNGDIFVLSRKSGDRTLIKGANVRSEITLDTDEIAFVNRQEKANDSVVYLDLKDLSRSQLVITDSTGNGSTGVRLPAGISGKDVYVYLQNNILQPNLGGKMFCAYSLFGSEMKNNKVYIYLWALCQEYRSENRKLVAGTGISCPITLIATPSQQGYTITEHQLPENGTAYAPSIKKMFPLKYYNEVFSETQQYDTVIARELGSNVETQARTYYGLQ
ncbi:MAG: hypothetical protein C0398_02390 [Coprothermobacter sp.]|nr:hypothetical protein [Coprothermobacter sp.]